MVEQAFKPPMPVKAPSGGAVVPLQQLEHGLDALRTLIRTADRAHDEEIAQRRQMLRPLWDAVDQPANPDYIATQLALLTAGYPNIKGADLDLFSQVFASDVAALKPTQYELALACRTVRATREFLSIATVVKEINCPNPSSKLSCARRVSQTRALPG